MLAPQVAIRVRAIIIIFTKSMPMTIGPKPHTGKDAGRVLSQLPPCVIFKLFKLKLKLIKLLFLKLFLLQLLKFITISIRAQLCLLLICFLL